MAELILHLEQHGRTLGEWTLSGGPLSLTLRDPSTGETVATFRAEVPAALATKVAPNGAQHTAVSPPSQSDLDDSFDAPTERQLIQEIDLGPPETEVQLVGAHFDEVGRSGLPANADPERIPGDDFTMPDPEPTDPEQVARARANRNLSGIGAGYGGEKTATMNDLEYTGGLEPLANGSLLDETTYIRPEEQDSSRIVRAAGVAQSANPANTVNPANTTQTASPTQHRGAAFPPISESRDPLLEVWFYKNDEWVRRGWLSSGQRASLRGGVIRCTRGGALLVSPGTWFTVSAVLPTGKQLQVEPGSKPVRLPAGSAVTLWDGERGLHVRDVETADDDTQDARREGYQSGQAAWR